ncbi:uncharacterized protein PFL1_04139 [Pseudozyma flocculosa PF-1]|uniref:Uncharacterized protein n=1 Tax=Pseudozyma flocculosa PF-1 TaxID=1277687 RepID=A0A061H5W5_9BASI|nr:uncharacterized protein PFL1_04139 [Pseudozyma flocculosa PF-1]EPQ28312.1 hypothetical protein PFL1_04139 [Pseudozyma flocculosa PF-1]
MTSNRQARFIDQYEDYSAIDLAIRYSQIVNTLKSEQQDNVELNVIRWLMWRKDAVAVPPELKCKETSDKNQPCKKPTIKGMIQYGQVHGEVIWLNAVIHHCLRCLKNRNRCFLLFKDAANPNNIATVDADGISNDELDVPKSGLSLAEEPDFDDPAHSEPIFGWSLEEVKEYVRRLRKRMEKQIKAAPGGADLDNDLNTAAGISAFVKDRRAKLRQLSDCVKALTAQTNDLLDVLYNQRNDSTSRLTAEIIDKKLYEGFVEVSKQQSLASVIRLDDNPTKAVVLLTDSADHDRHVRRLMNRGERLA